MTPPHPPELEELADTQRPTQEELATDELEPVSPAPRSLEEKNGHHLRQAIVPLPVARWPRRPADWFRTLGLPLLAALICGAGAFTAASLSTQWYRSVATLYFPATGNQGAANIVSMLSASGSLAMPTDTAGAVPLAGGIVTSPLVASGPGTALTVLSSARCQGDVMQRCNLAARWHLSADKAGERLHKNVSYSMDKNGLLAIEATDPDPRLAVQIVNTYIGSLRRIANELSTEGSSRNLHFLTTELAIVRPRLHRQQKRLVELQVQAGQRLPLGISPTRLGDAYGDLSSQKNAAQVELDATEAAIAYQNRAARLTNRQSQDLSAAVPFAQDERARLSKLETDFAVAKANFGPDNPTLLTLQAQVTQARADVKAETRRALSAVQQGISPATATLYANRASLLARRDGITQAMSQI